MPPGRRERIGGGSAWLAQGDPPPWVWTKRATWNHHPLTLLHRSGLQGPHAAATGPSGTRSPKAQSPPATRMGAARCSARAPTGKLSLTTPPWPQYPLLCPSLALPCPVRLTARFAPRWAGSAPGAPSSTSLHGLAVRCAAGHVPRPTRSPPHTSPTRRSKHAWRARRRRCVSTSRWVRKSLDRHLQTARGRCRPGRETPVHCRSSPLLPCPSQPRCWQ